jgi:hypothetical protein
MPLRPIRIGCFVIIAAMKLLKMAMHSVVRVSHVPVAVPTQGIVFPSLIVFQTASTIFWVPHKCSFAFKVQPWYQSGRSHPETQII